MTLSNMSSRSSRPEILRFIRSSTRADRGGLAADLLYTPCRCRGLGSLYNWPSLSEPATAAALREATGLDQGYLSRILASFERQYLIANRVGAGDWRVRLACSHHRPRAARFSGAGAGRKPPSSPFWMPMGRDRQQEIVQHRQAPCSACVRPQQPKNSWLAPATLLLRPHSRGSGRVIHAARSQSPLYAGLRILLGTPSYPNRWHAHGRRRSRNVKRAVPRAMLYRELTRVPRARSSSCARMAIWRTAYAHVNSFWARGYGLWSLLVAMVLPSPSAPRGAGYHSLQLWTKI